MPEFSRVLNVGQVAMQKEGNHPLKALHIHPYHSVPPPYFPLCLNCTSQVPGRRPVLCKLLAKDHERVGLAARFDIPELIYFAANVTVSRRDPGSIIVTGDIEAHIKGGELMEPEVLEGDFETLLLDNTGSLNGVSFDEAMDYDDEVDKDGNIDLGEIAAQYLSLELF